MTYATQRILGATGARPGGVGLTGSADHDPAARGVMVYVDMQNINLGNVNVQLQGRDPNSGSWGTIAQTANITTNGLKIFVFHPSLPANSANYAGALQCALPIDFRILIAEDAPAKNYGVSYELLY